MDTHEEQTLDQQLLTDHQLVKELYAQYKKSGDIKLVMELIWELTRHSIGEEVVVYPLLEKLGDSTVGQLKAEHKEVATLAEKMESLAHPSDAFDMAFDDFFAHLTQHVLKEESEDIPMLASKLSMEERITLGNQFLGRKKIEPTRSLDAENPHLPALKEAVSLLLGPVDKFRHLFALESAGGEVPSAAPASSGKQEATTSTSTMDKTATESASTDAKEDMQTSDQSEHEEEGGEHEEIGDSVSAAAGKRQTKKRAASPSAATSTTAPKKAKGKRGSAKNKKAAAAQ